MSRCGINRNQPSRRSITTATDGNWRVVGQLPRSEGFKHDFNIAKVGQGLTNRKVGINADGLIQSDRPTGCNRCTAVQCANSTANRQGAINLKIGVHHLVIKSPLIQIRDR